MDKLLTDLDNLPEEEGLKLAKYLRRYYFSPERIEKWSVAFRPLNWLINHNMHLESWHNKLKYYWFAGKANNRFDNCIRILWVSIVMSSLSPLSILSPLSPLTPFSPCFLSPLSFSPPAANSQRHASFI